ncbi:hypothetical protein K6T82_17980 [Flavobacterium sp. 17A]|uniref:VCBS repeat-containing protein n=1 Tax=Flavobacterium potami TaxID=2872310 RepID=A0A9X1HDV6_9FLAO|nr:hypothetical protein [Flavobacterium potami]MBZ4036664.1 hypothetical protein [Flavobacterium potami]
MKIIRLKLLFLILVFSFGCKKPKTEEKSIIKPNGKFSKEITAETINTEKDNYTYPVDSLLKVDVLWTEVFHSDEVNPDLEKKTWFGLFKKGNGYSLSETDISIKHAYDVIVDEDESEQTGWEVSTAIKDTCVILVEKLPGFVNKNVEFVKVPERIYPEENVDFKFLGNQYKLFATGKKRKESPESDWWFVSDYKLYLTTFVNGKETTELLTAKKSFDEQMIKIIFAGDLDGDGKLDLIIDTASHYNVSSLTLYLSKTGETNSIIKPVGVFSFVGC